MLPCLAGPAADSRCAHQEGLARLAYECRRRTSLQPNVAAAPIAVLGPGGRRALYAQPLLIWQGTPGGEPPLPEVAEALAAFVAEGGMLLVDPPEPAHSPLRAKTLMAAKQALGTALGARQSARVPSDHVLYRSFYLLTDQRGVGLEVDALMVGRRLGAVFPETPWLAALAALERGAASVAAPALAVGGGPATPGRAAAAAALRAPPRAELVVRMAINWLMYALCLDYKDDQVHLPALLERRAG